jgi:CO/xanthine dehydrogenase Mo-binding subunit
MAVTTMIGAKIHRREDPRLVSGEGRYVDDFTRPGTVFMAVVRSPHAHARIKSIDLTAASKAPDVVAVYTHKDPAQLLRQWSGERIHRAADLEVYSFDRAFIAELVGRLSRRMAFTLTVSNPDLYITIGDAVVEGKVARVAHAI